MKPDPHLTKSRYLDGLRCEKKLWLGWHERLPREEPPPFSVLDVGSRIGRGARNLFPGGVLVGEEAWDHESALATTQALLAGDAPALFEAAFEFENVRIRVDVLERLGESWGLREVKSSTSANEDAGHFDDVAVQLHVLEGVGLNVTSVEIIHVNNQYERGEGEVAWPEMLVRQDFTREARDRLAEVRKKLPELFSVLNESVVPEVGTSKKRCNKPYRCERIDTCMKENPDDWVGLLYRIRAKSLDGFLARGIHSISDIPDDFELPKSQSRVVEAVKTRVPWISEDLGAALKGFGPPAYYMDFETMLSGIPAFRETRPFETVPFQWSLHFVEADGTLSHQEYLASGDTDPRRPFAEKLIEAVARKDVPVVVYNKSFELRVLKGLAERFEDLKEDLEVIMDNVVDLLALVRDHVVHPDFINPKSLTAGTYSIKNVLPALVPHRGYEDLDGVADGMEAARVFTAIVFGVYTGEEAERCRRELLDYCERDTLAMVEVQDALKALAVGKTTTRA